MRFRRHSDGVEILAPAKLHLFFEIVAKRHDGFHEIITLMAPLSLYDTIVVRPAHDATAASNPVSLECEWAPGLQTPRLNSSVRVNPGRVQTEELPKGNDNIAVRAIELLRERAGIERSVLVRLTKRIPSAAGLGGGSSDAAAALVAANAVWNVGWSRQRLGQLAAELGSDVPFFLHSCPAVCRGRGEQIERVKRFGMLQVVVARPPAGLSTAAVYRECRPNMSQRSVEPLLEALRTGDVRQLSRRMHNALQPAAERLSPWVDRLANEFARMDCLGSQMSGSGTSYFGICRNARHAQAVANRLMARRIGRVFTAACG